ncbi:MAG TPA: endoglucanase [Caulobacteraceae bacterium]|jgi:tetratricopeptide (TPR) repeat protein
MRLRGGLRGAAGVAAILALAAPGAAAPAGQPLEIKVGQAADFSRVEFHWSAPTAVRSRREGDRLILQFSRAAQPNLADLRVHPPRFVKTASTRPTPAGLELTLVLAEGADAKLGQADGATFVNLFAAKPAPAAGPAQASTSPTPPGGVLRVEAVTAGPQLLLRFPWAAPIAAAVFRRGEAVWVVFDADAGLDLRALPQGSPQLQSVRAVRSGGVAALRFETPKGAPLNAWAQGGVWTVAIGPGTQGRPSPVQVGRDGDANPPALAAAVAGVTHVAWLDDPVVGDRVAVAMTKAPAKGSAIRRDFVDLSILPSIHGIAIERASDDLKLTSDGDFLRIARPGGLKLSPNYARLDRAAGLNLPKPAAMPALIDARWADTGARPFTHRRDQLVRLAAEEAQKQAAGDRTPGAPARMALARFLVGSDLSYEAIGVLDALGRARPEMLANAEFRGLRGAAKVMARRYKEAQTDFASAPLAGEPSSALWRGFAAAKLGQWTDADREFKAGLAAIGLADPAWRSRFARAHAEAALELADLDTARTQMRLALSHKEAPADRLATRLIQARLLEAQGSFDRALPILDAVARAPHEGLASEAVLRATQIRVSRGQIAPAKAAAAFDGLRYRWRGDRVELSVIRALGQLYLNQGRYREALEALRAAGGRLPDLPEALQLQADLAAAFRAMFLEGYADGLQPVQALAMFYDFRELTPIGADGDEMVRRLAQRLVNVDLLDQAAELLKYQAENRLDGVPRAVVATEQATIELMARRPEAALNALNSSRTTLLPTALQAQRRLVEARAWLQLNRPEAADELLAGDRSPEAEAMRAEIAWKRKAWPDAARRYEAGLGRRFEAADQSLTANEESRLLRAAVGYSLAEDEAALARLRGRYGAFVPRARAPEALQVALAGAQGATLTTPNVVAAVSEEEAFAGWVLKMKERMRRVTPASAPATQGGAPGGRIKAAG